MIGRLYGMLPSASLNESNFGLYEPAAAVHQISQARISVQTQLHKFSCKAPSLRYSLGEEAAAQDIETAVSKALSAGELTADLAGDKQR